MNLIFKILLIVAIITHIMAQPPQTSNHTNNFIIEVKLLVNNKSIQSSNISLDKQPFSSKSSFSYNLSSIHLKKNVTTNIRLFAWYNGYWTEKNTINIKITDRRSKYNEKNHLLSKILKYKSRNFANQMYTLKEDSILKKGQLFISYDASSSLLVSRLQYPFNFNEGATYIPIMALNQFQTKQFTQIVLQFHAIARSDDFIKAKNYIMDLYSVQNKLKDMIALVTAPLPQNQIQPYKIFTNIVNNFQNLMRNTKKCKQKQVILKNANLNNILIPYVEPLISDSTYNPILSLISNKSINNNDSLISTFNYIVQQVQILDTINTLKNAAKYPTFSGKVYGIDVNQLASYDILLSCVIGALWILMDIVNVITKSTYVSSAFIFYLKRWLFFEIILQSFKIGSIGIYYHGIVFLILAIVIEKLFAHFFQNKKKCHEFTHLDQILTQYTFNLIIIAIGANLALHLLYFKDIKGSQLLVWSFSQTKALVSQYYYFLVLIPSIVLTFKYKSTKHIGFVRIILLLLIAIKDNYWILLDDSKWIILFHLKQQIIFVIVLLLTLIYGNKEINAGLKEQVNEQYKNQ